MNKQVLLFSSEVQLMEVSNGPILIKSQKAVSQCVCKNIKNHLTKDYTKRWETLDGNYSINKKILRLDTIDTKSAHKKIKTYNTVSFFGEIVLRLNALIASHKMSW